MEFTQVIAVSGNAESATKAPPFIRNGLWVREESILGMRHSHNFVRHEAMSPYVQYIHTSAGDFTARNNQLWRSHLAIIIYKPCESYEDDDWLPWMLHWRSILALYSSSSWYIYSLATSRRRVNSGQAKVHTGQIYLCCVEHLCFHSKPRFINII